MVAKMLRQEDIHAVSRTSLRDYGHVDILGEVISRLVDRPEDMALNVSDVGRRGAFLVGKTFLQHDPALLILGDNFSMVRGCHKR